MWFCHLIKVFRSVSLDLTGYVAGYGPLEASTTLPDIESEILGCKCIFIQNNLVAS